MASRTGKKSNVTFTKPEEPSFLKKFKEKVGYKEDKGLMEKFEEMPKATQEDLEDNDDELPQVVQLGPEDLSQEEYSTLLKKEKPGRKKRDDTDDSPTDEKIVFRKPTGKRGLENDLKASTKKTKHATKEEEQPNGEEKTTKKKEKSNKTLLSFDDEDGEDST